MLSNIASLRDPIPFEDGAGNQFWLMPGGKLIPRLAGGAFDNIISRADAQATIPEPVAAQIMTATAQQSAALQLFTRVPLSSATLRMPVIAALPVANFVNGDTGMKQTTEVNWDDVIMTVEEIATIVPIPENVLADSSYDLWAQIRPLIETAVARALDAAIFFGTSKPTSWPDAIVPAAVAAGKTVARGTNAAAAGGVAEDINDLMALVEAGGYDVTGFVANRAFRQFLRGARDTSGQRLLDVTNTTIEGIDVVFSAMRGMWPAGATVAELIAGDFTQGVIGVRQDITYKLITEGVITDGGTPPVIIYNLPQQDMVALRAVARFAWAVPNPLNWEGAGGATQYPFGVLTTPAA